MALKTEAYQEESILSRPERAVIRGVVKAQQCAEALKMLEFCRLSAVSSNPSALSVLPDNQGHLNQINDQFAKIDNYLRVSMMRAITSLKVPLAEPADKISKPDKQSA